jgi:hypothetical protein
VALAVPVQQDGRVALAVPVQQDPRLRIQGVGVVSTFSASCSGEVGKTLCEEGNVGWLDLSGNAHLVAPGVRIIVEGKPNRFKRPGRPRSLFAPKSSRIARYLLMKPGESFSQRELAEATRMDEGFTSRIVRKLEDQQLVTRESTGSVRVADFDGLLDAWREASDFCGRRAVSATGRATS